MKVVTSLAILVLSSVLISACGGGNGGRGGGGDGGSGGGDGGDGGGGGTPPPMPVIPELLSDTPGAATITDTGDEAAVQVAFDGNGNGLAVWVVSTVTNSLLRYAIYTAATNSWSPALDGGELDTSEGELKLVAGTDSFGVLALSDSAVILAATFADGTLSDFETLDELTLEELGDGLEISLPNIASSGSGYAATWRRDTAFDRGTQIRTSVVRGRILTSVGAGWNAAEDIGPAAELLLGLGLVGSASGYVQIWMVPESDFEPFADLFLNYFDGAQWQATPIDLGETNPVGNPVLASNGSSIQLVWTRNNLSRLTGVYFSDTFAQSPISFLRTIPDRVDQIELVPIGGDVYAAVYSVGNEISAVYGAAEDWTSADPAPGVIFVDEFDVAGGGSRFAVTWTEDDDVDEAVKAAVYRVDTQEWLGGDPLGDAEASDFDDPQVVYNTEEFTFLWLQADEISGSDDVASLRTADNAFGELEVIDTGTNDARSATIYPDNAGNVQAVWVQEIDSGEREDVFAATDSGTWGMPQVITGNELGSSVTSRAIITNEAGLALAVWNQRAGARFTQWLAVRDADGEWGEPLQVADGVRTRTGRMNQFATNGRGFAYAIRETNPTDTDEGNVLVRIYENGMWSELEAIDTGLTSTVQRVGIASNGNGYGVAWVQAVDFGSRDRSVWGSVYDDGVWSTRELLSTPGAFRNQSVTIASNGVGYGVTWDNFIVDLVHAAIYDGSGWSTGPTVVAQSETQAFPRIISDGRGYLIYWDSVGLGDIWENVYAVVTPTGSADDFGQPQRLTDNLSNFSGVEAASGPAGYVMAWYKEEPLANNELFGSSWDGTEWSDSESLESSPGDPVIESLAVGDTGFAVLFNQTDTANSRGLRSLFANRFGGMGWLGPESIESSDQPLGDSEQAGAVIMASGDTFAVAWSQAGDDDDTAHIWFASNDGSGWAERQLEDQGTDADNPIIEPDGQGTFSVIWRQREPGGPPFVRLPWVTEGVE